MRINILWLHNRPLWPAADLISSGFPTAACADPRSCFPKLPAAAVNASMRPASWADTAPLSGWVPSEAQRWPPRLAGLWALGVLLNREGSPGGPGCRACGQALTRRAPGSEGQEDGTVQKQRQDLMLRAK